MKIFTETIGKVVLAVIVVVVLAGAALALPLRNESSIKSKKFEQKGLTQVFENIEKQMSLKNVKSLKRSNVEQINQLNFVIGHYIMRAVYDNYQFNDQEGVLYDLEVLYSLLENEPEAEQIKKLYEAVVEGTLEENQLEEILFDIEKSYAANLSEEQDWFLRYGEWTTCLMADTFGYEDGSRNDEYISQDLQMLEKMAVNAPEGDAQKVIQPIDSLNGFSDAAEYTEEDYEEMRSVAFHIFELTMGE